MIQDPTLRNRLSRFRSAGDLNTLTVNSFLLARHRRHQRIFRSEIDDSLTHGSGDEVQVNFQNLINKGYDARVFRRMMSIYLGMNKIILEEKDTHEIAKEVKNHPNKCFSHRSTMSRQESPEDSSCDEPRQSNVSVLNTTQVTITDLPSIRQASTRRLDSLPSGTGTSEKSLDLLDISKLSDAEIKDLVQRKMKKLDRYNTLLEKRRLKLQALIELLSPRHLKAIEWFQKRCRGFLMRRKFMRALRMNDQFEQRKNYMRLKKSLKAYQEFVGSGKKSGLFDSALDYGVRG